MCTVCSSKQQDKRRADKKNILCFSFLKIGHIARNCSKRKQYELLLQDSTKKFGKYHNSTLQRAFVEGFVFHSSGQLENKYQNFNRVLLMVNTIRSRNQDINTLWDPGANISLISHSALKSAYLTVLYRAITKVGNTTDYIKSKEYILPLTDAEGNVWEICVYGMNEVSTNIQDCDVSKIVHLFPKISLISLKFL